MFDLNVLERVGFVMIWLVHGLIYGYLGLTTVFAYFCTSLYRYKDSNYVKKSEIRWVSSVYIFVQFGLGLLGAHYSEDAFMYLVAGELKDWCEKYGAFCKDVGIMPSNDAGDNFKEAEGTSLVAWNF